MSTIPNSETQNRLTALASANARLMAEKNALTERLAERTEERDRARRWVVGLEQEIAAAAAAGTDVAGGQA